MNRRSFIQLISAATASIPFISFGKVARTSSGELEDFFAFCERHMVPMPWIPTTPMYEWHRRPFKLTPAQKYMAKVIHENKYVFVVKGRQIGFSLVSAAYSAWRWTKNPEMVRICGASPNSYTMCDWNRKFLDFAPTFPHIKVGSNTAYLRQHPWPQPGYYTIGVLDELNYTQTFRGYLDQLFEEYENGYTHSSPSDGKLIVGGTPDPLGGLYAAVNNRKYRKFKVLECPVTHYPELWDGERLHTVLKGGIPAKELLIV